MNSEIISKIDSKIRNQYKYYIIRFYSRPISGEFINIGIVIHNLDNNDFESKVINIDSKEYKYLVQSMLIDTNMLKDVCNCLNYYVNADSTLEDVIGFLNSNHGQILNTTYFRVCRSEETINEKLEYLYKTMVGSKFISFE